MPGGNNVVRTAVAVIGGAELVHDESDTGPDIDPDPCPCPWLEGP